jgi:hypothetical protein
MALNIKSERAHKLARELAEATGQSLTEAVTARSSGAWPPSGVPTDAPC